MILDPTRELRHAHDVLAEVYAERLAGLLDQLPIERALLGLFAQLVHERGAAVRRVLRHALPRPLPAVGAERAGRPRAVGAAAEAGSHDGA